MVEQQWVQEPIKITVKEFPLLHNSKVFKVMLVNHNSDDTIVSTKEPGQESGQEPDSGCVDNNLVLNKERTKKIIVNFRRKQSHIHHLRGWGGGDHISKEHFWTTSTFSYSGALRKVTFLLKFWWTFINALSSPSYTTASQYGLGIAQCGMGISSQKALQKVGKTIQRIIAMPLPTTESVQRKRCLCTAHSIIKNITHPTHELFALLPTRSCLRNL